MFLLVFLSLVRGHRTKHIMGALTHSELFEGEKQNYSRVGENRFTRFPTKIIGEVKQSENFLLLPGADVVTKMSNTAGGIRRASNTNFHLLVAIINECPPTVKCIH